MIVGQYRIKFGSCIKNKDKSRILTRLLKKVDVSDAIKFKNIDFCLEKGKYLGSWLNEVQYAGVKRNELVASYDTPTVIFYSLK
mgnify:FL=1